MTHKKLIIAGTLGDAFIVYCKLYSIYQSQKITYELIRYDLFPEYDNSIRSLFELGTFAKVVAPCRRFSKIDELLYAIRHDENQFIDAKWNKTELETYPIQYPFVDPFPVVTLPVQHRQDTSIHVGIQLHCGMEGHNFRGFSLDWLRKLNSVLPRNRYTIFLYGTNTPSYDPAEIESTCNITGIRNFVGKLNFTEWLSHIKSMDHFISLEGFSAFFAMSQRVSTILYNQQPYFKHVHASLHPLWLERSRVFDLNRNIIIRKLRSILNENNLYSPLIRRAYFQQ